MSKKSRCGSKRYGRTWKKIRNEYIKYHPFCEVCQIKESSEVHHIVPISEGGKHDKGNIMAVCRECHDLIHKRMREAKNDNYRINKNTTR